MQATVAAIFPKIAIGTHSKNFSRWINHHSRRYRSASLFAAYSEYSHVDGSNVPRDLTKTQCSHIYIGFGDLDQGYLHGSRLSEIICNGSKAGIWAFPPAYRFQTMPGWMDAYNEQGLCWLDPEHLFYPERLIRQSDGNSLCQICGASKKPR